MRILGRIDSQESSQDFDLDKFWTFQPLVDVDGQAGYTLNVKGEPLALSATQVLACYLYEQRELAEMHTKTTVKDVCISIPSYYGPIQRQAVLDACSIVNLNCLRLMHQHTATALDYGIYRANEFDAENPSVVAFCAMGHTSFSVSLVKFVPAKLEVLSEVCARHCGGRDLDLALMNYFGQEFANKTGLDCLSKPRSRLKLEEAVQKTKKTLSTVNEASCAVEYLVEEEDLKSSITRDVFEGLCQPQAQQITATIEQALAEAGLQAASIENVEIVGGSSRVPFVKECIQRVFQGKPLRTTLNQEECVAKGCALQGAMISPLVRVREFAVSDFAEYGITVGWVPTSHKETEADMEVEESAGTLKIMDTFPKHSSLDNSVVLSFVRKAPFELDVNLKEETMTRFPPDTQKRLAQYLIDLPLRETPVKVKVTLNLDLNGIVQVTKCETLEEEEYEVKEKVKKPKTTPEDKEAPVEEGQTPADEEEVEVVKKKTRTTRREVPVKVLFQNGLPMHRLEALQELELQMQREVRETVETEKVKNDLEGYVLNMKYKIDGELSEYMISDIKAGYRTELDAAEDWLYDHFETGTKAEFTDKLMEISVIGNHAAQLKQSHEDFHLLVTDIQAAIAENTNMFNNPNMDQERREAFAPIVQKTHEMSEWVQNVSANQKTLPLTEAPSVSPQVLKTTLEEYTTHVNRIRDERDAVEKKAAEELLAQLKAEAEAKKAEEAAAAEGAPAEEPAAENPEEAKE